MPNHLRQQIREAVATAVTGLTSGATVSDSRVYHVESAGLPALLVYAEAETVEYTTFSQGSRRQNRTIDMVIEAIAQATSDLEDTLDTLAKEVEVAIAGDVTLGGLAKDMRLQSTEIELEGQGEKPTGRARMIFAVDYSPLENDPTAAA